MFFEPWFLFTLALTFVAGITSFINKVIVEEKYDRNVAVLVFFLSVLFFSLGILFFSHNTEIFYPIVWYGIAWGIADYIFMKCRFIALSGISSSLFFINYRLLSSSALLVIGVLLFGDSVTFKECIGFFVGFIVFGLLFEKEKTQKDNYKKGLIFLGICILMIIFLQSGFKVIGEVIQNMDNLWFHFATLLIPYSIVGALITYVKNRRNINLRQENIKENIILNICNGILWMCYIFYLMNAYFIADLGIVYKIYSYSLFIPIILSIIFYSEKVTMRKIVAFLFTIVSLGFFM